MSLGIKGTELDQDLVFHGDFTFQSGLNAVNELLNKRKQFTAIWAQNDNMAAGALKGLIQRGVKVPEDISILGMDDVDITRMTTPTLSTIAQPMQEMAKAAVDLLLEKEKTKWLILLQA